MIYRGVVGAILLVSAIQARADLKGRTFQGSCVKSTISQSDGVQTGIAGGIVSPQLYRSVMNRARASHLELGSDGFLWAIAPLPCTTATIIQKDDEWMVSLADGDIATPVAIFRGKLIGADGPLLFMDEFKLGNTDAMRFNSHNNVPTCHFTFTNGGGGFTPGWQDRLEVIDCEGRATTADGHLITIDATFTRTQAPLTSTMVEKPTLPKHEPSPGRALPQPPPTMSTLPSGIKVATLQNGKEIKTLVDGTVWVVLHPGWTGTSHMGALLRDPLAFQVTNAIPTASVFKTNMVINLPESDIVNAPQSERIEIEGECQSRTYDIWGVTPYANKAGGGMPEAELATGPEGVYRKVMPDSPIWYVFDIACKNP